MDTGTDSARESGAAAPRVIDTDAVVVGLGLVGAGAIRHLAVDGAMAVGIGPGEPEHLGDHGGVFASHYDSGRITRLLDPTWEWAELAARSVAEYPVIAERSRIRFHHAAGTVFASRDPEHLAAIQAVGDRQGVPMTVTPPERGETLPDGRVLAAEGRLALPAGSTVVSEPAPAGWIDPRRMLRAQLTAAAKDGATLVHEEVAAIEPDGTGWAVHTRGGVTARATRVIVATGAHTDELPGLPGGAEQLHLAPRPETVVMAVLDPAEADRLAGIPSVLSKLDGTSFEDLYMVPPTAYPDGTIRLKLGATLRRHEVLDTAGSRRAWMAGTTHAALLPELRELVEALVPGIDAVWWETKPCMITDTPSGLPVVAHLAPGLVVAAGGNGFAAKSADAIGRLAVDLVTAGSWVDPGLPEEPFALSPN